MSMLTCSSLTKSYAAHRVLDDVSVEIGKGELVTLLGPSGCGKTTLLRMIAGLSQPDSGSIRIAGQDLTHTPIHRRNIGMVFQSHALFRT
jgi:putative spermidine/putrescine transport system ATP-binding protein